jgi:hypothetical protein
VVPVLRTDAVDVAALYREWEDAGEPKPTPEEVEEYDAPRGA